ncbi:nucleotidyltransferase domain-containing protein [Candidatus Pacearchaeota archaeon]|nr:nucleotidyltransferase domain-containing protein [Candidatus Pacearchaeota archaeon]
MRKAIAQIKKKIEKPLRDAGVVRAGIFGSYARGEQTKNSDIDILIEVKGRKFSLLDLVGLENKIHKILKKKIDLLTYGAINKYLKERILSEEVQIL